MEEELNENEIVLNNYLKSIDKDLKTFKKNKKEDFVRRRIEQNLSILKIEIENFALTIDNCLDPKIKGSFTKTLERIREKQADFEKQLSDALGQNNARIKVLNEYDITPAAINEVVQKINLCDMQSELNRAAGIRSRR